MTTAKGTRLIHRDELANLFLDHYWDSLEKDRELILGHINSVFTMIADAASPASGVTEEREHNRLREFCRNVAASLEVLAIEAHANSAPSISNRIQAIAQLLRERAMIRGEGK